MPGRPTSSGDGPRGRSARHGLNFRPHLGEHRQRGLDVGSGRRRGGRDARRGGSGGAAARLGLGRGRETDLGGGNREVDGEFPGRVAGAGEEVGGRRRRVAEELRGEVGGHLRSRARPSPRHRGSRSLDRRPGHRDGRRGLSSHRMRREGHRERDRPPRVRAGRSTREADGLRALDHEGGLALRATHGHPVARHATLVELEGILAAWASDLEHRSPSTARHRGLSLRDRYAPTSASLGCALPASPDTAPHPRAGTTSLHRRRPSETPPRRWRSPAAA